MSRKFLDSFFILFLLVFINQIFADEVKIPNEAEKAITFNSPARIAVKGEWDFYLSAHFVYWIAKEEGISVASVNDYSNFPFVLTTYPVDTSYKPGFKVAFGMNCGNYDNWVVGAEYTRFHIEHHQASASIPLGQIAAFDMDPAFVSFETTLSVNGNALGFTHSAGKWKNEMDLIDVNLCRAFYSGKKLTFSPFLGLRSGWLDQHFYGNYVAYDISSSNQPYLISSKSKQHSWTLGPRVGFFGDWLLGSGFRLCAEAAGAILYQHFHNSFLDTFSTIGFLNTPGSYFKQNKNTLNPNLDCELSLGYGTYFANNKWHFDLTAGYSFQIFFYQNRLTVLSVDESNVSDNVYFDAYTPANLILHGLNVAMRFDF